METAAPFGIKTLCIRLTVSYLNARMSVIYLDALLVKVVNIKANTALVVRSLDVLSTSNLHFVVHTGSKLTFSAKGGITLDRDEVCTLYLTPDST